MIAQKVSLLAQLSTINSSNQHGRSVLELVKELIEHLDSEISSTRLPTSTLDPFGDSIDLLFLSAVQQSKALVVNQELDRRSSSGNTSHSAELKSALLHYQQ